MKTREQRVSATLIELADTLVSDYDLFEFLDVLLQRSVAVVGAAAGGVLLSGGDDELEPLASSHEEMLLLELLELQRGQGPCVDSYRSGEPITDRDLAESQRWPLFAPVAVERGYRSVLAIPLRLRGEVIGALGLYRTQPGQVEMADAAVAQAFADMATIGILHQRSVRASHELAEQMQGALTSRILIEQAKGMLAERGQVSMSDAFQALRRYARNHNLHLRAVAADLVTGELGLDTVMGVLNAPPKRPRPV